MMQATETADGVLVLTVTAERIDAASAVHFKDGFRDATAAHGGRVVMDLAPVSFMDSSGLGAMVAALKSLGGRKLEICGLAPAVDKVFRLTRMDKVFIVHEQLDRALTQDGPEGADAA
ncbi:STAS domain-containing protein [Litoreibacter arenae]|uniref:Anti-sigma factor antagonist n=1 Tax=Litoreibacter arenae DSM 19593 TaxID=1123360 RepID=S9RV36_9RHOB|nr:STAS domain-containing protein [Litoreibacter arenae]EPX77824.1 Anti-sigma F factor antagonist (spoIIAA-2) / Anti-sigma B factor antagonist RsbV [Litoreibacter arenae DSM 19593]